MGEVPSNSINLLPPSLKAMKYLRYMGQTCESNIFGVSLGSYVLFLFSKIWFENRIKMEYNNTNSGYFGADL